ncbi:toxin-antitoxin system, antitoxin component, Phd/YefM family [Campylobacter blaseri]|uniref:Antitoxin n=1 Tax=Campylobacter blaseri TaxID=2042961 RepID=A0A2P8R2N8_9BACT|nr:type II toxin-antitoxin system prevent-host-death family antitoxin [Campylobacter blaseri]PSM52749.1 prevent-host-death protein [Campylobacter blaseri]PSM54397.1 prevent-host-death protein [Campylobacter blaseri]QKF86058.1 toxin-antitoxin system, antitoxin component, Phd/YefM family [Campylobacter blaseri]
MASFKQNEIFTATEVVRNFSSVLTKVSSEELKKAVIVKNNKFEAVILGMKEYERLEKAVELLNIVYSQKRQKDGD